MKYIAAAIPGRIRIKNSQFCNHEITHHVLELITKELPVQVTRVNLAANSIIIQYDAQKIAPSVMQQQIELLLASSLGPSAISRKRRSTRLRINRYAKIGALTSLTASLAFALSKHKRLHVATGYVFLACLGTHLAIFRRTMVR